MVKDIEILAPVGSMEALHAAVENGAKAVYLGGKVFNARQYASNFDNEELKEAVKYAHIRNVRIYITVNILLEDSELREVIDYILYLYNIGVDALIVQDLGLTRIVRSLLPDFEIHGSTQMTINNYMGAKILEEFGFKRVVLARELSTDDIKFVKENSNIELEAFIHGALCVSYSGQCLMSSMIGGRSGNRGRCAQPCRMPYSIVEGESSKAIGEAFAEKYLLSPKDLNTIDYLEEIIESGITSLKIEGRMKRPEYVAVIVDRYKKALNNIINGDETLINERDKRDMTQMFNREFTKGFMMKEFGRNFISYDRPDNRGLYIGRVIKADRKSIHIKLEDNLNKGDGIEIDNGKDKRLGLIIDKLYIKGELVTYGAKGSLIEIRKANDISIDSKVYKTSDIKLLENTRESYRGRNNRNNFDVYMSIKFSIGKPIELHLWDDKNYVKVISEELVEEGIKTSLSREKIKSQMDKLGDTPYNLKDIEIYLDDNSMVPLSVLNKIRREAIEEFNQKREGIEGRREISIKDIHKEVKELFEYKNEARTLPRDLISIKVNRLEQFKQLDLKNLDRIYLAYGEDLKDLIKEVKKYNKEIYISTDKILENEDFKDLDRKINGIDLRDISGISVSNLGTLKFIKDNYDTKIHCDIGLNVFNTSSVQFLNDYGVSSLTLSPELKLSQISNICDQGIMLLETIGHGYLPLMTTKHCPMSLVKGCKTSKECDTCKFRSEFGLVDRKNMRFPMERKGKNTTIYNSQSLMILDHINKIYASNVNMIRLDFTIEKEDIRNIQKIYFGYVNRTISEEEMLEFIEEYRKTVGITKGHYFRGVL